MKARMKTVLCGSATVFAFTVLSSTVVFAAPSTDSNNIEDSVWSYRAVADVDTQVNIRANASTKSEIVGYLPKGASADLIEKGEKWSHIISNGVEGYINRISGKCLWYTGRQGQLGWCKPVLFTGCSSRHSGQCRQRKRVQPDFRGW